MLSVIVFVVLWMVGVALADSYLSNLSVPWVMCVGYTWGMFCFLVAGVFK